MRHMRLFVLFIMLIRKSVDATAKSADYHFALALQPMRVAEGSGAVKRLCISARKPRKQPAWKAKQPVIGLIEVLSGVMPAVLTPMRMICLQPQQRQSRRCCVATGGLGFNGLNGFYINAGLVEESLLIKPPGPLSVIGGISSLWFCLPVHCRALRTSIHALQMVLGQEVPCDCQIQRQLNCSAVLEDLETCCADPLQASTVVLPSILKWIRSWP